MWKIFRMKISKIKKFKNQNKIQKTNLKLEICLIETC